MNFNPLTIPSHDSDYLDIVSYNIKEISRVFKVPEALCGSSEVATFHNSQQAYVEFNRRFPKIKFLYYKRLPRKTKKRLRKDGMYFKHLIITFAKCVD